MRKCVVTLAAAAAILLAGVPAQAQLTRGAANISTQAQNFTPVERAACGPHRGRWCGPFHTRVCRHGRCWCARC